MKKYALIIGNDKYADKHLSQLKTPAKDARELEKVISNEKIGGFESYLLINKAEAETRREISKFLGSKKPDDLVLVYFSGHGVLDNRGRLFLAFRDTQSNNLSGTAIPSTFITDILDDCRSKRQILILDCCHSGAFAREGKKVGEQKAITKATFEGGGYGRAVLTASSSVQFALEGNKLFRQKYLSLFTRYLLEGLKTGDADKDGDGDVSLDEWFEYTYSKVVSETSKQKPQKWIYEQEGKLLIAKNPSVKKTLPIELLQLLVSPYSQARLVGITELAVFFQSQDGDLKKIAILYLRKLKRDANSKVSEAAKNVLIGQTQPLVQKPIIIIKKKIKKSSKKKSFDKKTNKQLQNSTKRSSIQPTGPLLGPWPDLKPEREISVLPSRSLRVFLSYSNQDRPIVRKLYQKLRAEAWIDPWLDEEKLIPGQNWSLEIEKAIKSTDVVLVCLSKSSISKEGYIQREMRLTLDFADERPDGTLSIIPVRLEECVPPRSLAHWHFVDYFGSERGSAYQKILNSLRHRAEARNLI